MHTILDQLSDGQRTLLSLWAHTDWRYVAAHFIGSRRLRTPEPIAALIHSDDPARIVLAADCWHADHHGVWAGGPTSSSSHHLLRWAAVYGWLNTWPTTDRQAAVTAYRAFTAAVTDQPGEQHPINCPAAQLQAAMDRRQVRLDHGGFDTICETRRTVQALIHGLLDPTPPPAAAQLVAAQLDLITAQQ